MNVKDGDQLIATAKSFHGEDTAKEHFYEEQLRDSVVINKNDLRLMAATNHRAFNMQSEAVQQFIRREILHE